MAFDKLHKVIFTKGGAKNKYDISSDYYHLIMGVFEIKPNLEALELREIKPSEKILDLAFGTGWVLEKMIEKINPEKKIHGIDFAEGMHKVTLDRLKKKNIQDMIILTKADVLKMLYKKNTFDVVFGSFILDLQKNKKYPNSFKRNKTCFKTKWKSSNCCYVQKRRRY